MIVIDNFLPYPDLVRAWALQQEFLDCEQVTKISGNPNTWPGLRTKQVSELDINYANNVLSRVANLGVNIFGVPQNLIVKSAFQLTREQDGNSWIHVDNDVMVAGLLYLTPNAPVDAGTTIYDNSEKPVDVVGNVYNRLVLYSANKYHKSTRYFGNDLNTGRLTQVFFIKGAD